MDIVLEPLKLKNCALIWNNRSVKGTHHSATWNGNFDLVAQAHWWKCLFTARLLEHTCHVWWRELSTYILVFFTTPANIVPLVLWPNALLQHCSLFSLNNLYPFCSSWCHFSFLFFYDFLVVSSCQCFFPFCLPCPSSAESDLSETGRCAHLLPAFGSHV